MGHNATMNWLVETAFGLPGGIIASGGVAVAAYYVLKSKVGPSVGKGLDIVNVRGAINDLAKIAKQCIDVRCLVQKLVSSTSVRDPSDMKKAINGLFEGISRVVTDESYSSQELAEAANWAHITRHHEQRFDTMRSGPKTKTRGIPELDPLIQAVRQALEMLEEQPDRQTPDYQDVIGGVNEIERAVERVCVKLKASQEAMMSTIKHFVKD
jgi:hypothetical protein